MKLRELISQLQTVEARVGGEFIVDVGLNHEEDGFCSKPVEEVDAETFEGSVILHGGNIELAEGVTIPEAYYISREVLAERYRQQGAEGYAQEHDDLHTDGSLALAAAAYAEFSTAPEECRARLRGEARRPKDMPESWPQSWLASFFKPTTPRRDLVKAAALIVAEIERLDRKAGASND